MATAAVPSFKIGNIGQITIPTNDVDRATIFYRDKLGMKFLFRAGEMAFFETSGLRIMLAPPEHPFEPPGSVFYYKTDDLDASYAELARRGVVVQEKPHFVAKMPDHELWMAFFRDSEGNLFALMQAKR